MLMILYLIMMISSTHLTGEVPEVEVKINIGLKSCYSIRVTTKCIINDGSELNDSIIVDGQ